MVLHNDLGLGEIADEVRDGDDIEIGAEGPVQGTTRQIVLVEG